MRSRPPPHSLGSLRGEGAGGGREEAEGEVGEASEVTGGPRRPFQLPSWRTSMVGWKGEGVMDGETKEGIQNRRVLEGVTAGWLSYSPLANLCEVLCQPVQGLRFRQNIPHNGIHDGARGGRGWGGGKSFGCRITTTQRSCVYGVCGGACQEGNGAVFCCLQSFTAVSIAARNTRRPLCHPLPSGNRSYTPSSRITRKQFRMA